MAINEACQLWIEQRVPEGLEEGKSYRQIGREISKEIEKVFEVYVKPETIRKRAERQDKGGTNVPPQPTAEDDSEKEEIQIEHGGEREGAGRPPKHASPEEDSGKLFQLKLWWRRSTKKDKQKFLKWIKEKDDEKGRRTDKTDRGNPPISREMA